jgi:prevent-host-death family protein
MSIETTYTAARANFAKLLDSAVEDREIIMIRRRRGEDVALIAADELESLRNGTPAPVSEECSATAHRTSACVGG